MQKYKYKDYYDFEEFFIGKINGAFSAADMGALKTGLDRLKSGDVYVEIGTQFGRSTYVAACMMPSDDIEMYAVDIFDPPADILSMSRKKFWKKTGLDKRVIYTDIGSYVASQKWDGREIAMLFIDGDHSYEGVKADVDNWTPFLKKGGYVYFHDADKSSPGVAKLVKELAKSGDWDDVTTYKTSKENTSIVSMRKV